MRNRDDSRKSQQHTMTTATMMKMMMKMKINVLTIAIDSSSRVRWRRRCRYGVQWQTAGSDRWHTSSCQHATSQLIQLFVGLQSTMLIKVRLKLSEVVAITRPWWRQLASTHIDDNIPSVVTASHQHHCKMYSAQLSSRKSCTALQPGLASVQRLTGCVSTGFSTAVKELVSVLQICRQSRSSRATLTMHCLRQ